jgi:hypothetical protein
MVDVALYIIMLFHFAIAFIAACHSVVRLMCIIDCYTMAHCDEPANYVQFILSTLITISLYVFIMTIYSSHSGVYSLFVVLISTILSVIVLLASVIRLMEYSTDSQYMSKSLKASIYVVILQNVLMAIITISM